MIVRLVAFQNGAQTENGGDRRLVRKPSKAVRTSSHQGPCGCLLLPRVVCTAATRIGERACQRSTLPTAFRYASLKVGNWATVSRSTSIGVAVLTASTAW